MAVSMVKTWTDMSVLIVGCGSIGKRHARVLRSLGVADIRACDPRRSSVKRSPPSRRASACTIPSTPACVIGPIAC